MELPKNLSSPFSHLSPRVAAIPTASSQDDLAQKVRTLEAQMAAMLNYFVFGDGSVRLVANRVEIEANTELLLTGGSKVKVKSNGTIEIRAATTLNLKGSSIQEN